MTSNFRSDRGSLDALRRFLPPPPSGGDAVDWEALFAQTGTRLPGDYREFVEVYGGGMVDSYISILVPPVLGYPYYAEWQGAPSLLDEARLRRAPDWLIGRSVFQYGANGDGDEIFWLCESAEPETWETLVYKRQRSAGEERWKRFPMGMVRFWTSVLGGEIRSPFSAGDFPSRHPTYVTWRDAV